MAEFPKTQYIVVGVGENADNRQPVLRYAVSLDLGTTDPRPELRKTETELNFLSQTERMIAAMACTYTVKAVWDAEAGVWISQSDIIGLHIEAPTLDEFEDVLADVAGELVAANHVSTENVA